MTEELIDIIYAYRDRDVQRIRTSFESLKMQEDQRFRVTFVDYGSTAVYSREAENVCKEYAFCTYYYISAQGRIWNRGDALNHGILLSKGHDLFLSDIDMVFRQGFVAHLHDLKMADTVHFFPVGYLNERATKKVIKKPDADVTFKKSENFASGMLLASRKVMNAVNGYNSFYCIWGLEDNDLRMRMIKAGFKTLQIEKVFMLHMYHMPVPGSMEVPDGWIQYMKDYYLAQEKHAQNRAGLMQCISLEGRPALQQFLSGKLQYKTIEVRKLYLRHILLDALLQPGTTAMNIHVQESKKGGFILKKAKFINLLLKKIGIHVVISSPYAEQYIDEKEILAELYFAVKSMAPRLIDYYVHSDKKRVQFIAVCR